ncbi:MAG: methyltransferase domain-containing protein, partial [Candidatus Binatia bacterium]
MSTTGNAAAVLDPERAVYERYARGAVGREESLCCPVDYDPRFLEAIPREVIERDYGCGDPSRELREGETVLDLGSGAGKVCFIAAQVVGPGGRVIGVDLNEEMLSLARGAGRAVAERLGYENVEFRRGRIQDLRTDLDAADAHLAGHPIHSSADLARFESFRAIQRETAPLVAEASVDVIVSNCVLNLSPDKPAAFREAFRVLRPGGRFVV